MCVMQGALKSLFPSLLEVAGRLVQAGQAACQAAGSHLYTLLFAAPTTDRAAQQQQVCKQPTCCCLAASHATSADSSIAKFYQSRANIVKMCLNMFLAEAHVYMLYHMQAAGCNC